jgi:hypothetical protein
MASRNQQGLSITLESAVTLAHEERSKQFCLGEAYGNQQATNKEQFTGFSMPGRPSNKNYRGQSQQRNLDSPMGSAKFQFDRRIQMTF